MSRTQFSLRSLLAAVAAVGIGAALWTAEPSLYVGAIEAFLLAWVLGSTAALSVHSTGKHKTFWMGVTAGCAWPLFIYLPVTFNYSVNIEGVPIEQPPFLDSGPSLFLFGVSANFRAVLLAWAFAPVVGLLCVFTHWLLIRPPQGPQARGSAPEPKD